MRSVQPIAVVLILAALLGCLVMPSEAARAIHGSQKNFKSLMPKFPGCSPPPAPVDTPYTPTTPDTYTPTPITPSEPSPVYSPPTYSGPPAGGY
ncbi:hypothetical protein M758_1G270900 [Ceratodon purpureus]|nr:hypothetical protein M758_1G270900 [Ceratodon purpureus]